MEYLHSVEQIEQFVADNKLAFLYFSVAGCDVCTSLYPKVKAMLQDYPLIESARIEISDVRQAMGSYSAFTIPLVLMFIEGTESIRMARHISMEQLEQSVSRFYYMVTQ